MAITNVDGTIAGFQYPREWIKTNISGPTYTVGRYYSGFYQNGIPGPAVAPTPGLAGAALTSYAGQLPFTNPVSGNTYLTRLIAASMQTTGTLILCDRLWHNSGIVVTTTTAQTINSVAWPARDADGSTNGNGVYIGLEISTATGAGAATPSISYTDEAGTAGNTGSMLATYGATSPAGTFYPFTLAAGDKGVRSIQTVTLGVSMTSGTIHLVAYRELARIHLPTAGVGFVLDLLATGMVRMFDNTVPFFLFVPSGTTTSSIQAQAVWTQG